MSLGKEVTPTCCHSARLIAKRAGVPLTGSCGRYHRVLRQQSVQDRAQRARSHLAQDVRRAGLGLGAMPRVGERLLREIFESIHALSDHAEMGPIVPEFDQPFLRELIRPPFRIVYRHGPKRVRRVHVWRDEPLLEVLALA